MVMAALLTEADKAKIRDAIKAVELNTSGEVVTVIAGACDDYLYIPTLWAALLALALPGLVLLSNLWLEYAWLYSLQVLVFFLLAALFRIPAIKLRLVPRVIKHQRASRVAREQFFLQNLHHTRQRTGILLFVSTAENYVEIIADKGINDVVPAHTWEDIVARFVTAVRQGQYTQGFLAAIGACGTVLQEHFPAPQDNPDELPNHLVEL
jgi:putative membrane protein